MMHINEEKLSIFVKHTPAPIAMFDNHMNYIIASDKWHEMYILDNQDIKGKNHYELFPEIKKKPKWVEANQRALNGEVVKNNEDLFISNDGTKHWVKWSVVPWYIDSDTVGGIIMSTEDITDTVERRKQITSQKEELEKKVSQRTKELEKANKELEAFCYSVSHDLRSPLRAITGFGQILRQDYGDKLDEEGNRLLNIVLDNAQHMGELIDDLLMFSRVGRSSLSKSPINLTHLCNMVFQGLLENHNELKHRVKPVFHDLPTVNLDPKMMRQALENLLSNALKYSSQNEKDIKIEVGCEETPKDYIIFIKDNGIGFDTKYSHKLFEIFQRLHSQTEFEGTGVGLSLVQRIINRHGGEVWADSEPGEGATFYFNLPKKDKND